MTDETPAPAPAPPSISAGWYPDPSTGKQRWWDGSKWTEVFAPDAATAAGAIDARPSRGTASLALGIVALVLAFLPALSWVGLVLAILAAILGFLGLRQPPARSRSFVGLILGAIAFVLAIVLGSVYAATVFTTASSVSGVSHPAAPVHHKAPPLAVTPTASAAPTPTPTPASLYGTYPASEARFVAEVNTTETALGSTSSSLQSAALISGRDKHLCSLLPGHKANNWVGTIHDIGANGDGYAWVNVEIAPTIVVQTWNNDFSDAFDHTLIKPSKPFFSKLVPMKVGQKIRFSGTFLSSSGSCLEKANLTQTFYGLDPNFIFKFSNVSAQ